MQTHRERSVGAARVRECPRVLTRARGLGDDEEREESARAVGYQIPAREEDEEHGGVVRGEERVSAGGGGEDGEVEEIRARLRSERRQKAGIGSIWRFFDRHDITFKKNSACRRAGSA